MVSIIVPCYNCEKTFDRCIKSIQAQTQPQLEIILVDDGSEDGTAQMCDKAAEGDSRIKVIHQKNKGLMNAWKEGVFVAAGEYVAFCDSDDYIDNNMIEVLEKKAVQYHVDIVLGGMVREFPDKTIDYADNKLAEGYYRRKDIEDKIMPSYFSCGQMQSRIILASRDTKLFRKDLLIANFQYLDDGISLGEDVLTTFASILSADSIFCLNGFYPYHYMKNNSSMIGKYDENMFQKYLDLRERLRFVAGVYNYIYMNQIDMEFLSNTLLCMKKEISRNKGVGYRKVCARLKYMRENAIMNEVMQRNSIKQYDMKSKMFAWFIVNKQYYLVYFITKAADFFKMGKK